MRTLASHTILYESMPILICFINFFRKMNKYNTSIQDISSFEWFGRIITHSDYYELLNLLNRDIGKPHIAPAYLHKLFMVISFSKKYNSSKIPKNVITMYSEFILVTEHKKKQLVRIVLPQNIQNNYDISIYNPIAIACLGAKEGNQVHFQYKGSCQKLLIEKLVSQPELIKPTDFADLLVNSYIN